MSRSVVVSFLRSPVASAQLLWHPSACMYSPAYLSSRSAVAEAQCPVSQTVRRSCWCRIIYMFHTQYNHEYICASYILTCIVCVRCEMYCEVTLSVVWCLFVRKIHAEALMIQVSSRNWCHSLNILRPVLKYNKKNKRTLIG